MSGVFAQGAEDYEQLFRQRGHSYDQAMRSFPGARRDEFAEAVRRAGLRPGMRVADVPAGGGYLAGYLPVGCECWGHEPCASFVHAGDPAVSGLLPLPWADASVDAVLSIAGVHHLQDKRPLFAALARACRPAGDLLLADVWRDSVVARFLDEYVGRHNSTGHRGIYLDEATLLDLQTSGWQVGEAEIVPLRWHFAGEAQLAAFCTLLFDLRQQSSGQVLNAVERYLGIDAGVDGLGMRWELAYIHARRSDGAP